MEKKKILCMLLILTALLFLFVDFEEEYVDAFNQKGAALAEERAQSLIKKLYGRGVEFQTVSGDGTVFVKRYYCGNICIDACDDGSIRYLSDVNDADGKDAFLEWLYSNGEAKWLSKTEFYGYIDGKVNCGGISAEVCIDSQSGRAVAARIIFNS